MLAGAPAYVYNGHTIAINRDNRYGVYMKKRIALLLVLIIALSVCIGALVGCDAIITRNEDRDANQVVASVSYAGQTADIRKFELAISFNSYAYIYNAYYGMTYQQAADYLLQSLAQRELLVLFAKDELVKMEDPGASAVDVKVEDLLSSAELNRAIENVNEDILSAIDTAIGTLISANKPSTGGSSDSGEYEEYSGTDAITVRFDSGKGSAVERQRIKNGTVAYEPDDPTREGTPSTAGTPTKIAPKPSISQSPSPSKRARRALPFTPSGSPISSPVPCVRRRRKTPMRTTIPTAKWMSSLPARSTTPVCSPRVTARSS